MLSRDLSYVPPLRARGAGTRDESLRESAGLTREFYLTIKNCVSTFLENVKKTKTVLLAYFLTSALIQTFHRKVFFFFFGLIKRRILLSRENIFSLATLSAIIYHIRSNKGIWADNQD